MEVIAEGAETESRGAGAGRGRLRIRAGLLLRPADDAADGAADGAPPPGGRREPATSARSQAWPASVDSMRRLDADLGERAVVFGVDVGVEQDARDRPGCAASRSPGSRIRAGPAPSRHSRAPAARGPGPRPSEMARRISSVAVRQMPSSIGSVAFSMKKSAECSTKPRPVSTGPPRCTRISSTPPGRSRLVARACTMSSWTRSSRKLTSVCQLVDDDAHGAVAGMRADIDDRAGEPLVRHARHGDQELAVEKALRSCAFRHAQMLPIRPPIG